MQKEVSNISNTLPPTSNPFSSGNVADFDQASFRNTSFKDVGGPSIAASNDEDIFPRESLGILPSTVLVRDSLTSDFFTGNINDPLMLSPRESLGILNISSLDIGRESIGIFNINHPVFKREFTDNEMKENLALNDFPSVMISSSRQENSAPQIFLSSIEDKVGSPADLDKGFLFPHSRKFSGVSSGSSGVSANPSFNSRSLEDPSKILSISSIRKDIDPSMSSTMAIIDPLNEAFHFPLDADGHSVSYKSSSTHYSFVSDLENIRNRIQSLPSIFERKNVLEDIALGNKTENMSFDEGLICRGIQGEKDLDDSVFLQDEKRIYENTSFNSEKSFDGERYLLDSTPQPQWEEWDTSKSTEEKEKSPIVSKEEISKKVDKMLGMLPVKLEEKLKLKNSSKCDSTASINISSNISKISRASQCSLSESNFSQHFSKISHSSEENVSNLIRNLSDIINEKENLTKSQKNEGRHMLQRLASLLRENSTKISNSEDSGHSSVEDPQLEVKQDKVESAEPDRVELCEALDLSCKNKPCNKDSNKSSSRSKSLSFMNPPPYRLLHGSSVSNASDPNVKLSNKSQENTSNHTNTSKNLSGSSVASLRRHSNISQNRVTLGVGEFKKAKGGIISSKKEPLRAILPVENMAKSSRTTGKSARLLTPERHDEGSRLSLKSKKTSTPLQEPKLKPMAASTPANRQSKEGAVSSGLKPNLTRSLSYQPKTSELDQPSKSKEGSASRNITRRSVKVESSNFVRRNSITENVLNRDRDTEGSGSPRLKRSFSTGKEPKIFSALSKVRQNILSSPYYKSLDNAIDKIDKITAENASNVGTDLKRCSLELKSLSKHTQLKKVGKENLKP